MLERDAIELLLEIGARQRAELLDLVPHHQSPAEAGLEGDAQGEDGGSGELSA